jgi:multidrug efflux system membrane fusion protein
MRPPQLLAALAYLATLFAAAGCSKPQQAQAGPPVVPVSLATVEKKSMPVELAAIGNVEAYSTVSIKAQVSGVVTAVHFQEGDFVRRGQLLFTIDPRPFQAALQQAQANLARDTALAENAHLQAARYEKLLAEGVASSQQNDQFRSDAAALDAAVRADRAAAEKAQLDLEYCTINSPIDGRTGYLMVHAGNLTKANDVPILVVINQLNPIYVNFAVPEQYLASVKKYMAATKLTVRAAVPDGLDRPEEGTLTFVDNTVDTTTGTIHLKATFANQQRRLWPGQYVKVVLTLSREPNAVVIPSQAVQSGQNGDYVFVVKSDNTVDSRQVVIGRMVGGETVIEKGLQPGEIVVTDGQLRLVPGSKIKAKG